MRSEKSGTNLRLWDLSAYRKANDLGSEQDQVQGSQLNITAALEQPEAGEI